MSAIDNFILNLPLPFLDHWGYLILFLSSLVEALPILGTFVPGHTIVIFGGFLVYLKVLRLDAVILVAFLGAVIGDSLAYFIGLNYGHDFITRYGKYFFLNQDRYERTKKMVQEHAGKTLIIGRFGSVTRAISAFVAGTSKIKFSKFIIFACLGGLVWAVSSVFIGYIFGQSFEVAAKYFGRFILIAILAIIIIIFSYHFINKKKQIFTRYHIFYLTLNALSVYAFFKMLEDYSDRESTLRFDYWLDGKIGLIQQPWLDKLMIFIDGAFSFKFLSTIILLTMAYFIVKRRYYRVILVFLSTSGGFILGRIIKWLVERPRPVTGLISVADFSFPSQHAALAMIVFSLIMFFYFEKIRSQWLRRAFVLINLFFIILVGFSRIYLKVHWFSDCVAGYALGLFWLTFLILIFRIFTQLVRGYPKLYDFIKKNIPE